MNSAKKDIEIFGLKNELNECFEKFFNLTEKEHTLKISYNTTEKSKKFSVLDEIQNVGRDLNNTKERIYKIKNRLFTLKG